MSMDLKFLSEINKSQKEIIDDAIVFARDTINHGGPIAAYMQPTSGDKDRYKPYVRAAGNMIKSNFFIDSIPVIGNIVHDENLQNILKNEIVESIMDAAISGISDVVSNAISEYSTSRRVGYDIPDSVSRTADKSLDFCSCKLTGKDYTVEPPAVYFVYT